jgi:transposase
MTGQKKKQTKRVKARRMSEDLPRINPDAAGIDVGATEHYVAVPSSRDGEPVRRFETFTSDLYALADWLKQCDIRTVAMESTGVYWIPLFQILEDRGFEVKLVNAKHVKNVAGRKTDVSDCQWIQILHSYGLLSGSFRPAADICVLRSYLRHREMLVRFAAIHVQHMQKALTQMNLHLHHVISDITGATGMAIIRAIIAGERNLQRLAEMRDYRVKASEKVIIKSLEGDYRLEHLFALTQAVELFDFYRKQITDCDEKTAEQMKRLDSKIDPDAAPMDSPKRRRNKTRNEPRFDCRSEAYRICGVDLTKIDGVDESTALMVVSEAGPDMSPWRTEKHFASWLALCPNNRISGGQVLQRHTRKVVHRLRNALRMCAQSLLKSKSALGAYCRRMCARLGAPHGITATAHKLARLIYRMLKFGQTYADKGQEHYDQKYKEKLVKNLSRRAHELGFQIVSKSPSSPAVP